MPFDKVLKFGGAALADGPAVQRAAEIVLAYGGPRPLVVVSAHQGVTDLLETVARSAAVGILEGDRVRIRHRTILRQLGLDPELLDRHVSELFNLLSGIKARGRIEARERDLVLSFGERMSARVVAHTLRGRGQLATPVDAFDLGLVSDSNHGAARPLPECRARVRAALDEVPGIPVVTGFLAQDRQGNLTTLGRNGSDLTAALMAEAVGAGELQLWKAVGGIMTADPALEPEARVVEQLGFVEAAEFAFHGAQVLHGAALAPAQRANVTVRLLDVHEPEAPGTVLTMQSRGEGPLGIAVRRKLVRVSFALDASEERGRRLAEVCLALARHGLEATLLGGSAEELSLYLSGSANVPAFLADVGLRARTRDDLALVALIGRRREPDAAGFDDAQASRVLALLSAEGLDVVEACVGRSAASQLLVVPAAQLERVVRCLHAQFFRPATVRA